MKAETPLAARAAVRALAASKIRELYNEGVGRRDVLAFWVGEPDEPTPDFIRQAHAFDVQRLIEEADAYRRLGDEFSLEQRLSESVTLRQHLSEQLQIEIADPTDRAIGACLIDQLDEEIARQQRSFDDGASSLSHWTTDLPPFTSYAWRTISRRSCRSANS